MSNAFSVRPRIYPGECLTSIMIRYSAANDITFEDFFSLVRTFYYRSDLRNAHQIDINPTRILDINAFQSLLKHEENLLDVNSFHGPLLQFLNVNKLPLLNNSSTLIKDIFVKRVRRFCPDCLKENIFYKLLWQVKDIEICPTHNTPITSKCPVCGKEQSYIHSKLNRAECFSCGSSLTNTCTHTHTYPTEKALYSKWLFGQWLYLFSSKQKKPLDLYTAITNLIYICSGKSRIFNIDNILYIKRDYKYKLLKLLSKCNEQYSYELSLKVLFTSLFYAGLTFPDFINISFPEEFNSSLSKYINKKNICCIAPWCEYFGTSTKLHRLSFRSKTHNNLHICLGCSVKFGKNKNSGKWEEYGDIISIGYNVILPLINEGLNKTSIAGRIKASRYKVNKYISYLAQFKLITTEYAPELLGHTLSKITFDLKTLTSSNETKMRKMAKQKYNIDIATFYYHFYNPVIQATIYDL
jgi:hypothetical protein